MPELRSYRKSSVPRELAIQIVSYVRVQWAGLLGRRTPLWESTPYPADGMHFVLTDDDVLIGHALAHFKRLDHIGQSWTVGALSSVFVYPTHRGSGYGRQIAAAATDHFRAAGVDFALLFCGERASNLYLPLGWELPPALQIIYGDPRSPQCFNDTNPGGYVMALRVSPRAVQDWSQIESSPLYVGERTW